MGSSLEISLIMRIGNAVKNCRFSHLLIPSDEMNKKEA
jgi:hypothetical protein